MNNSIVTSFDSGNSALIESSAGTGKTFTITLLVLRLLLLGDKSVNNGRPLDIENILVVTFTNAAAAELKARILSRIHSTRQQFEKLQQVCAQISEGLPHDHDAFLARLVAVDQKAEEATQLFCKNDEQTVEILWKIYQDTPDAANFAQKLKLYARLLLKAERSIDNASISTIHSFCNRALNQIYSFEAGKAFNVELTPDVTRYREMAVVQVWRELFYKDSAIDRELLHSVLRINDPAVFSVLMDKISGVQAIDPQAHDSYFGFYIKDIYNPEEFYSGQQKTPQQRLCYLLNKIKECEMLFKDPIKSAFREVLNFSPFREEGINSLYPQIKLNKAPDAFINQIEKLNLRNTALSEDIPDDVLSLFEPLVEDLEFKYADDICFSRTKKANNYKDKSLTLQFEAMVKALKQQIIEKKKSLAGIYAEIPFNIAITMYRKFKQICSAHNVISLDQVLFELAECLCTTSRNEIIRKRAETLSTLLRHRYPVALIDEFQDTDPVQFEIFNSIYLSKNRENKSVCYLIGDPKQSIYRFRGSDINSYNKAKAAIEANAGKRYELPKNFRSSSAVVEGVNAIFEPAPLREDKSVDPDYPYLANAFMYKADYKDCNITFSPADYDEKNKDTGICFGVNDQNTVSNRVINLDLELDEKGSITADTLRKVIARAVAADIAECLKTAYFSDTRSKIGPKDIAVLVRTGGESEEIIRALKEVNIPAVYYSDKSSVLFDYEDSLGEKKRVPSEAALNIVYLMEAMCDFTGKEKIARLFGSSLVSSDYSEFKDIIETDKIDDEILLLAECFRKWENFGFATAFFSFLMKKDLFTRIMSADSGERALTDYVHISEIIQTQHGKILGARSQMLWFKEMLFSTENNSFDADFEKKRLESEKSLVKIYTIHSSKGLQFPVVFLPYLYSVEGEKDGKGLFICGKSLQTYTYYDPEKQHLAITQDGAFPVKTDGKIVNAKEIVKQENMQENVRLAYVALTRAEKANFLYIPRGNFTIRQKPDDSAFRAIIKPKNNDFSKLKAIDSDDPAVSSLFSRDDRRISEILDDAYLHKASFEESKDGAANKDNSAKYVHPDVLLKDLKISECFSISSYTSIKGPHQEGNDHTPAPPERNAPIRFRFAKSHGVKAKDGGIVFHKLMELILKNQAMTAELNRTSGNMRGEYLYSSFIGSKDNETASGAEYQRLRNAILSFNFPEKELREFFDWAADVLSAEIKLYAREDEQALKLLDLTKERCACEMEYYLPSKNGSYIRLNDICADFLEQVRKETGSVILKDALPSVRETDFKGYVKGEMDLVAQFRPGGAFYLIDYKTNYLGNRSSDYNRDAIAESIFESRYDVQILLYSIALHRLLKNTAEGYCDEHGNAEAGYRRLFGGVIYLYVRGMASSKENSDFGAFYVKPDYRIIEKLDALFDNEYSA